MTDFTVLDSGLIDCASEPVIYTTIFGADDSFLECLQLMLESLSRVGHYKGSVALFSDRPSEDVAQFVPKALKSQVFHRALSQPGYFGRYGALDDQFAKFAPILYLDTDIIIDREIEPWLTRIRRQRGVCVTTEVERYGAELVSRPIAEVEDTARIGNWWGLELLRSDPDCAQDYCIMANSGILGYSDYETWRIVSKVVLALCAHPAHEGVKSVFNDQPFLNYALVKLGAGNVEALKGACSFTGEAPPGAARGFAHFVWAWGAASKLNAMRNYLTKIV